MIAEGRIAVEGGALAWDSLGDGPPLLLLHGFSFDRRAWEPQIATLARHRRVIRYDLRGFGASSLPIGPYCHVADLQRVVEVLRLEQPAVLGLSLGAVIALNYAAAFPDRLSALILASPGLPGWRWTSKRPPDAAAEQARAHGVEAARAFWLAHEIFASARRRPGAYEAIASLINDYHGWHWRSGDAPVWTPGLIDLLDLVTTRTLVISGERDVEGYRDIARALAERLPDAELVRLDAGHTLNIEAPEAFNTVVDGFLTADAQSPARVSSQVGADCGAGSR